MVTPARFERAATYLRRVVLYPLSYGAMNRLEYISTIGFLLLYLLEKSVKKGSRGTTLKRKGRTPKKCSIFGPEKSIFTI